MLVWLMRTESSRLQVFYRNVKVTPQAMIAIMAFLLVVAYSCIPDTVTSSSTAYSATAIQIVPLWVEAVIMISGAIALIALAVYRSSSKLEIVGGFVLCLATLIQITVQMPYGTWTESKKQTLSLSQTYKIKKEYLYYIPVPTYNNGMYSSIVLNHVKRAHLEPFLGKFYKRYLVAQDNKTAYDLMEKGRSPDQIIVEQYKPDKQQKHEGELHHNGADRVELSYSSFNRLAFDVWASGPGLFGLAYPFTRYWKALVNNQDTAVYRANGISHAVHLPAGYSRLEFRYWSAPMFWGIIISCATFTIVGLVAGLYVLKNPVGIFIAVMALILSGGWYFSWHESLYAGKNLETDYTWKSSTPKRQGNLAYGKKTRMSSIYMNSFSHLFYSGRGVDGDIASASGFITDLELNPSWVLDLNHIESIGLIVLYLSRHDPSWNMRPLLLRSSIDGKTWETVTRITDVRPVRQMKLQFKTPLVAKHIMLQASKYSYLSVDEVEIYPPGKIISREK